MAASRCRSPVRRDAASASSSSAIAPARSPAAARTSARALRAGSPGRPVGSSRREHEAPLKLTRRGREIAAIAGPRARGRGVPPRPRRRRSPRRRSPGPGRHRSSRRRDRPRVAQPAPARPGRGQRPRRPLARSGERLHGGVEVAGRRHEVAAARMDPAELQLDAGQLRRTGHGRRRLERADRGLVVALRRPHLADRDLDAGIESHDRFAAIRLASTVATALSFSSLLILPGSSTPFC